MNKETTAAVAVIVFAALFIATLVAYQRHVQVRTYSRAIVNRHAVQVIPIKQSRPPVFTFSR